LEILVAADIIAALQPALQNDSFLGAPVVVRTFLGWSLIVEIEQRWPLAIVPRQRAPRKEFHGSSLTPLWNDLSG